MKRIAMLAAFPPPVSGQSLAAQILHDGLDPGEFHVFRLNLAESINGDPALRRLLQLAGVASRLCALCIRDKSLIVYMQLGFGRMAILRDIVYLAITRAFGRRCIVHVHGSGFRVAFDSLPKPLAALDRLLLSKVDCAIVLSQSLCDMFDGIVPKARIAVVKNGVSPRVENAARKYLRPMRDAHTPFRILFLSNLLHAKGFATLLEAAVLAQAAGHDWHFTFVGPKIPGQTIDIQDFITAHRLKNVLWRGAAFGSEKIQCYREADCFVLPSEFE
ncbi:MAG: glycosyltransferase, partial [Proteobacteria bacterium]|nr:glycosyltransferase [Pseudomonadota bacterium]